LFEGIISQYGQDICNGLVAATAGGIQVYMLPGVSDTFWALMEWNRQETAKWFHKALINLPSHNASGVVYATTEQIEHFFNTVSSATSIKTLWDEFREFSKYYR